MNLRQIEIFCAVMQCRTTIAAAYELGISQPAVSNAIKQMEVRFGLPLFERVGKRLVPTAEAEALYYDAKPLYAMSQAIANKLSDLRDTKHGYFRVVSTHALARTLVAPAFARFIKQRPRVKGYVDACPMEGVLEAIVSGFAAFGFALMPAHRPGLNFQPLVEGSMVVAIPYGHPLADHPSISATDLKSHTLIGLEPASRIGHIIRQAFKSVDAPYSPLIEVRHCTMACTLVEQGVGAAVVDGFSAATTAGWKIETRPFIPETRVSAYAISIDAKLPSRLAQGFIRELQKTP